MLVASGATLVMKRLSFIGDGLSHVAFGAYAVAAVTGITHDMLVNAPITVLAGKPAAASGAVLDEHGRFETPGHVYSLGRKGVGRRVYRQWYRSGSSREGTNATSWGRRCRTSAAWRRFTLR